MHRTANSRAMCTALLWTPYTAYTALRFASKYHGPVHRTANSMAMCATVQHIQHIRHIDRGTIEPFTRHGYMHHRAMFFFKVCSTSPLDHLITSPLSSGTDTLQKTHSLNATGTPQMRLCRYERICVSVPQRLTTSPQCNEMGTTSTFKIAWPCAQNCK